jgi:putative ABC transport system substrate-binding protein
MMRRRFLAIGGAGLFAPSLASLAQQSAKVWRIGVLHLGTRDTLGEPHLSFFNTLRQLGYTDGSNINVQWLFAGNDTQRLSALAGQLVTSKVDLIVTHGTPAVGAARQATTTIPILALTFGDPVASGFARSLARPGGNVTGMATLGETLHLKRLEILCEIVPNAIRIGYLVNSNNPFHMRIIQDIESAARKLGTQLTVVQAQVESELVAAFEHMHSQKVGGRTCSR